MTDLQRIAIERAAETGSLTPQQAADALNLDVSEVEHVFAEVAVRMAPPPAPVAFGSSRGASVCRDTAKAQQALTEQIESRIVDHPRGLSETRLSFDERMRRRINRRRDRLGR